MKNAFPICLASAVAASGLIALLDLHASEVQPAAALILAGSALFAIAQPTRAWAGALIFGLGILIGHLAARVLGFRPSYAVEPNVFATLLALIPAALGAVCGVALRWIWDRGVLHRSE
jgi:hypothetical protein